MHVCIFSHSCRYIVSPLCAPYAHTRTHVHTHTHTNTHTHAILTYQVLRESLPKIQAVAGGMGHAVVLTGDISWGSYDDPFSTPKRGRYIGYMYKEKAKTYLQSLEMIFII